MTISRIPSIEGGIQPTLLTAKGDLISATAASTPQRLAVGSDTQILVADSSTATGLKWAAPAGGGKVLQVVSATYSTSTTITTTTYTDTGLSLAITPTLSTSKILVIANLYANTSRAGTVDGVGGAVRLLRDATVIYAASGTGNFNAIALSSTTAEAFDLSSVIPVTYYDAPATTSSITYKVQARPYQSTSSGQFTAQNYSSISTITLLEIGA